MIKLSSSGVNRNWIDFSGSLVAVPGTGLTLDSFTVSVAKYKLLEDNEVELVIRSFIDLSGTGIEVFLEGLPYDPDATSYPLTANLNHSGTLTVGTAYTNIDGSTWRIVVRNRDGSNLTTSSTGLHVSGKYPVNPT